MKYWPTWFSKSIFEIDWNALRDNNIRYVIFDLDNTLAPYNIYLPDRDVVKLVKLLKEMGFTLIVASNNSKKRVEKFTESLEIDYIYKAFKPFTSIIDKYLVSKGINKDEVVMVGDQLMTDIKCATKLKVRSILTTPISDKESWVTFINRKIDSHCRKKYQIEEKTTRIDRR